MTEEEISMGDLARFLRKKYVKVPENETERIIDSIEELISKYRGTKNSIIALLEETAEMICRRFEFQEVAIGLKDPDGLFRFKVFVGFTKAAEEAQRGIEYTYEMMTQKGRWGEIQIGKHSEFTIEVVEEEIETYNRPSLLAESRTSFEQFLEGDIVEVFMYYGDKTELIGWIELSKTQDGEWPSRATIKWLELIASIIARIMWERGPTRGIHL